MGAPGKAIGAQLDKVAQWIGDRLGISARDEIMVDAQITNLLTPGSADKTARRNAIRGSKGLLTAYSDAYKGFQRQYRKNYSKRFLERLGYAPTTSATTRVLNDTKVLTYLQDKDSSADEVERAVLKFITAEEAAYDWMEDNIGWSNYHQVATDEDKTWVNLIVSDDGTDIQMDFTRDCEETIVENLTNNYSYDSDNDTVILQTGPNTYTVTGTTGTGCTHLRLEIDDDTFYDEDYDEEADYSIDTPEEEPGTYHIKVYETADDTESLADEYDIEIEGSDETYNVPAFDCTVTSDKYTTTVTRNDSPDVDIKTTVEYANWSISNDVLNGEKLFIKYNRDTQEWYYYIEDSSAIPEDLYTTTSIDMTAIVPLKEDNNIINSSNQEKMLARLSISPDLFGSSLANPDMDSAYIMTGLYPGTTSNGGKKALFRIFDLMLPGSGNVNLSMSHLSMTYSFTMEKNTLDGEYLPVGTYSNELTGTSTAILTLRWQVTPTQCREIVISNYVQTYVISGTSITSHINSASSISRLIIPISILKSLGYRDWVEVYEESLSMLAYSIEIVHFEWYESENFATLLKIIAIVVVVISLGTLWEVGVMAWTSAATIIGAITAVIVDVGLQVIIMGVLGYLVSEAINTLLQQFGVETTVAGLIITAIIMAAISPTALTFLQEQWLMLSNKLVDDIAQFNAGLMSDIQNKDAEDLKQFEEENSEVLDMLAAFRPNGITFDMNIASTREPLADPSHWCDSMSGVGMCDNNILYDVDTQIDKRKEVKVA